MYFTLHSSCVNLGCVTFRKKDAAAALEERYQMASNVEVRCAWGKGLVDVSDLP